MERSDAALFKILRDGLIGREHEFFDDAVGDIALAAHDAEHAAVSVEFDYRLWEIEINRAARGAASVQQQRERFHAAKILNERSIAFASFGVAFEDFVDIRVSHALGRANH